MAARVLKMCSHDLSRAMGADAAMALCASLGRAFSESECFLNRG